MRSWRPWSETGGTGENTNINRPNWTHCRNVSTGTWRRNGTQGSAYSFGSAVKFADRIGIDLSIRREYSSSQQLVYNIRGAPKKLCGSNDEPAQASKIMEKLR